MTAYLIRRSLSAVVVLLGTSVFIFLMLHVIYPSPAIDVLGPHANKFSINQWNRQHGFDDSWIVQYLHYLNQLLHGNLGYSYKLNQSVAALFQERWLRSAYLSGVTLFLSVVIAIPLGIYQAVRRNTVGDSVVTTGAFVDAVVLSVSVMIRQVYPSGSGSRPRGVRCENRGMNHAHRYAVELEWTGNRGTGTSAYKAYGRDHLVSADGKHRIEGSSDRVFFGVVDNEITEIDLGRRGWPR